MLMSIHASKTCLSGTVFTVTGSMIDIRIISSRVAYSFWIIENPYSEGEDFDGSWFIWFVLFF